MQKNELFLEIDAWASNAILNSPPWSLNELNYSEKSITVVDIIINELSEKNLTLSDEKIQLISQEYGCYLLMTAYKLYGGVFYWNEQMQQPMLIVGEPDNTLILMTWNKVKGRLLGDESDHLAYFLETFALETKKKELGRKLLFS